MYLCEYKNESNKYMVVIYDTYYEKKRYKIQMNNKTYILL